MKAKPGRNAVIKAISNLPRLRVIFALRKLEHRLVSDVIADGIIAKKFNIPVHRSANLGPDISVHHERLLRAFRSVLAGKSVTSLQDANGKRIPAKISITETGTAHVVINEKGFSFAHAGLLSENADTRRKFLELYLNQNSIAGVYADDLRAMVSQSIVTDDNFRLANAMLSESPESFVQLIKAQVTRRDLSNSDFLPEEPRHWDNLVAPWRDSKTLDEFIAAEGGEERKRAFRENPVRAFFSSSLSYCAPALVPHNVIEGLSNDTVLNIVERASTLPDHFAVVGAFEICAKRLTSDTRFLVAGTKLLDQLLGDFEQLKERCTFFAAVCTLTLVRLAQHENLRRKPPFWRRITAAANASLVIRACGTDNAEELFKWVVEHAGKSFVFSTILEEAEESRWKPEWLSGNHLMADAFGRLDAAVKKLSEETRPADWVTAIEKARQWITEKNFELFAVLPAMGESARRPQPLMEETSGFRSAFEKFCGEPTVDGLIECTVGIYLLGVPVEVAKACRALIGKLQQTSARLDDNEMKFALQLLSYAAVLSQDEDLAESVGQFAIEKVRELADDEPTLELLCRLVECSSAHKDRKKATDLMVRWLEVVSFSAKPAVSLDLYDSLKHLQILDDNLSKRLGRALAAARLGRRAA